MALIGIDLGTTNAQDLYGNNRAEMVVVSKNFQLSDQEIEQKKIDIEKEQRFEKNKEENRHIE